MGSDAESADDPALLSALAQFARLDIDRERTAALAAELRELCADLVLLRRAVIDGVEPAPSFKAEGGA